MNINEKTALARIVALASTVAALGLIGCSSAPADEDQATGALADEAALGLNEDAISSFRCDGSEDENHAGESGGNLLAVRASAHPEQGFDRFVMEFEPGADPNAYLVRRQRGSTFTGTGEGPGSRTKVDGEDGIAVIYFHGEMISPYSGPRRVKLAGGKGIKEVAQYDQFEANIEWGLGTQKNPCFRTSTLLNPPRLIVDVKR